MNVRITRQAKLNFKSALPIKPLHWKPKKRRNQKLKSSIAEKSESANSVRSNLTAQIDRLQGLIAERNAMLQQLEETLTNRRNDLVTIVEERRQIDTAISSVEEKLISLQSQRQLIAAEPVPPGTEEVRAERLARLDLRIGHHQARLLDLKRGQVAIESRRAEYDGQIAELRTEIDSLSGEELVITLKERSESLQEARNQLQQLRTSLQSLEGLMATLSLEINGLWRRDLDFRSGSQERCEILIAVDSIKYQKVFGCKDQNGSPKLTYESGIVTNFISAPRTDSQTDFAPDRLPTFEARRSSCKEPGPTDRLSGLKWTEDAPEIIEINLASGATINGLERGDKSANTFSCNDILANVNRPGLEITVAACQLLNRQSVLSSSDVGCFTGEKDSLIWTAERVEEL